MPAAANRNVNGNDIAGLVGAAAVPFAGPLLVAIKFVSDARKNMVVQQRNAKIRGWILGTLAALGQAVVVAIILRFAHLG